MRKGTDPSFRVYVVVGVLLALGVASAPVWPKTYETQGTVWEANPGYVTDPTQAPFISTTTYPFKTTARVPLWESDIVARFRGR